MLITCHDWWNWSLLNTICLLFIILLFRLHGENGLKISKPNDIAWIEAEEASKPLSCVVAGTMTRIVYVAIAGLFGKLSYNTDTKQNYNPNNTILTLYSWYIIYNVRVMPGWSLNGYHWNLILMQAHTLPFLYCNAADRRIIIRESTSTSITIVWAV